MGTSAPQTRATGASSSSNACSMMIAAISPAKPPNFQSSSTTTARWVLRTHAAVVSTASGRRARLVAAAGVADEGDIFPLAVDLRLPEGDRVLVVRHLAFAGIERGVLDEDHRVRIAGGGLE